MYFRHFGLQSNVHVHVFLQAWGVLVLIYVALLHRRLAALVCAGMVRLLAGLSNMAAAEP